MADRRPSDVSRRRLLQAGAISLLAGAAKGEPRSEPLADAPSGFGKAKHCILVYLLGGPPHLDLWDPKPLAPAEVRGPIKPIATRLSGVHFSEHLPKLAGRADRLAVVRSVTYPNHDHPYMIYFTLTGRVSPTPLGANTVLPPSRNDHPHMGSVVARYRHADPLAPAYVAIPEVQVRMLPTLVSGGGRAGFLGPRFDPMALNDDPREPSRAFRLPADFSPDRLGERDRLLAVLDGDGARGNFDLHRRRAMNILGSARLDKVLRLENEPEAIRGAYGRGRFGQSLLLARRLVEAGTSFVAIHFNHMSRCDGWDTHGNHFESLAGELAPMLDQSLSALLDDLQTRGLLDETLVVTMGEFGRTPRVNANGGRDHWGNCASVVFAGGGVKGGQVVGASDRIGAYPISDPYGPPDTIATIYHAMGLAPAREIVDPLLGRPMLLCDGAPIAPLFG